MSRLANRLEGLQTIVFVGDECFRIESAKWTGKQLKCYFKCKKSFFGECY